MSDGQVTGSAAEVYERFFVPILAQWTRPVLDAADVRRGHRVLDVACGTGVLAREAASRAGDPGLVTGLDPNDGMLAVARRLAPAIGWRSGRAEALPFPDAAFDAAVSQFGIMFFGDRAAALREMRRVVRPGGRLAVAAWGTLAQAPGYAALDRLMERLLGAEVAAENRAPFVLGDPKALAQPFVEAGLGEPRVRTVPGEARFPSLDEWMNTEVKGWTLADKVTDAQYAELLAAARTELQSFVQPDGTVRFPMAANVASAERR